MKIIVNQVMCAVFCLGPSLMFGLVPTRVILSSDKNSTYLDFWPLVAKAWQQNMGVRPTLALIDGKNIDVDRSLGDVIDVPPLDNVPSWLHALYIRMFLPVLFEKDVCIISDIDMLPLSREMLCDSIKEVPADCVVIYWNPYVGQAIFSSCYFAASGKTFREIFGITTLAEINACVCKAVAVNDKWGGDEEKLYYVLTEWENRTGRLVRLNLPFGFEYRISRVEWNYDVEKLKNGFYYDAHMLRPLQVYNKEIAELAHHLNLSM